MRIALLTRRLDGMPTNGFERYSHNLYAGLSSKQMDVLLINQYSPLPVRPSGSWVSPPYYDVLLPVIKMLGGGVHADVYHALTDSQAVLFPFLKGRKVVTIHHVDLTPPGSPSEAIFRRFYTLGTAMAVRYADHFICISQQTKRELMKYYGVREDRITVIPQSISPAFHPTPKKGMAVGYLGALRKRKNVDFIIRAFALMQDRHSTPECKLMICGEGPEEERLRALVHELGIDPLVEFKGLVPEDRILATYNSFTVFAFPSLQEGFGFPILEAQACGVPVLTLKGAMIPEEVAQCTVPCSDEGDMAEKIYQLLSDEVMRERVIKEGIDYAATFSVDSLAEKTIQVYEKLVGTL